MSEHERVAQPKRGTSPLRLGLYVLVTLVVLTVVEYVVALQVDKNLPIMIVMNIADAALIMVFFMHLPRLWREED